MEFLPGDVCQCPPGSHRWLSFPNETIYILRLPGCHTTDNSRSVLYIHECGDYEYSRISEHGAALTPISPSCLPPIISVLAEEALEGSSLPHGSPLYPGCGVLAQLADPDFQYTAPSVPLRARMTGPGGKLADTAVAADLEHWGVSLAPDQMMLHGQAKSGLRHRGPWDAAGRETGEGWERFAHAEFFPTIPASLSYRPIVFNPVQQALGYLPVRGEMDAMGMKGSRRGSTDSFRGMC